MTQINVGIIGFGYWGPNLTRNLNELPTANVVAVADLREERLNQIKSAYPSITITKNYKELFNMGLDAVVIATPPASHYALAKECLENGLHVLVEKPLTLSSRDGEDLIEIANQKNRILMVGHTFEYNPAVRALRDIITSPDFGDIYYVNMVRVNLGLYQRNMNVMWDLAPHDISILLYLLGTDPSSVAAQGATCVHLDNHDVAYLHLKFPNNITAQIHVSWLDPNKVRRITVVGSKKMVVYDDIEPLEKLKIYDKGVEAPAYATSFSDFQFSYRYGDVVIPYVKFEEPLRVECRHFVDCIVNSKTPQSDGEVGTRVVRILEALDHSLHNEGVSVKIQNGTFVPTM